MSANGKRDKKRFLEMCEKDDSPLIVDGSGWPSFIFTVCLFLMFFVLSVYIVVDRFF